MSTFTAGSGCAGWLAGADSEAARAGSVSDPASRMRMPAVNHNCCNSSALEACN
eukprot:CAMPEP_0180641594 /NCGR_PEP_ID=MMETSP1037_2-20121125/46592_1 /TAXON_ID=632150 /ORGANISM="Azadinium spinosum, Strain 3D9" /LENGTH=53 /DNA_ID=CAMNT_0022664501 /DNA_START=287 /DNA_END=445 /DNA_ORIENTATION=+